MMVSTPICQAYDQAHAVRHVVIMHRHMYTGIQAGSHAGQAHAVKHALIVGRHNVVKHYSHDGQAQSGAGAGFNIHA